MFWICKQRHWALATVDIGAIQMHHIILYYYNETEMEIFPSLSLIDKHWFPSLAPSDEGT